MITAYIDTANQKSIHISSITTSLNSEQLSLMNYYFCTCRFPL